MIKALLRWLTAAGVIAAGVVDRAAMAVGGAGPASSDGDTPTLAGGQQPLAGGERRAAAPQQPTSPSRASGPPATRRISLDQAGELRGKAAQHAKKLRKEHIPSGPTTFDGRVDADRPEPDRPGRRAASGSFVAMSGRIGALAIRPSNGQFILGGAQGGIWLYDSATGTWSPKTNDQRDAGDRRARDRAVRTTRSSTPAPARARSRATRYFGNGVLKSTDGGNTWAHVSRRQVLPRRRR